MMSRVYVGLDIGASSLRAVLLRKKKGTFSVAKGRVVPFSMQKAFFTPLAEKNNFDKKPLLESLTQLLASFAEGEDRLALSLPESTGRLILTDVDAVFGSKKEGREFLRWRLKKQISLELEEIHLDYQVLKKTNTSQKVLVSLASKRMVEQLEELFGELGFFVSVLDFHALNCFNYYYPIFEGGNNFCFISFEDNLLNFFYFAERVLSYYRCRLIPGKDSETLFHEIQRSIIDCRRGFPEILQNPLYFHADDSPDPALLSFLDSFFSGRTVFLEAGLERFFQTKSDFSPSVFQNLVAAVGVAKRLMANR